MIPSSHPEWSYAEALGAIWDRSGYDRGYISNPFAGEAAALAGLERTRRLLERLGGMPKGFPILHIAGSKGKGSTAAFLGSILNAAGHRTGLYTSPHLHQFRERIAISGQPIDEAHFARLTRNAVISARACEQESPDLGRTTAFELVTAMALHAFAASSCDIAVIETGLGGSLDATNIVDPAVSIITALDYEHTAVLGNTLAEIASNKAGIIKPGRPVVSVMQAEEALSVIEAAARTRGAPLGIAGRDWKVTGTWRDFTYSDSLGEIDHLSTALPGDHQMDNAALAIAALGRLDQERFLRSASALRVGLRSARWPGRYERVASSGSSTVILDGAHTPASAAALAALLAEETPDRPLVIVVGLFADKDERAFVAPFRPLADHWIVTAPNSPRAMPISRLGDALTGAKPDVGASVAEALSKAQRIAGDSGTVVVTGSLATVAEARVALGLARPDPSPAPSPL